MTMILRNNFVQLRFTLTYPRADVEPLFYGVDPMGPRQEIYCRLPAAAPTIAGRETGFEPRGDIRRFRDPPPLPG